MTNAMAKYSRQRFTRALAAGVALLAAAACSDHAKQRAQADSDLARDLALAGSSNAAAAQPTFQDTSLAPTPTPASHAESNTPSRTQTHAGNESRPHVERERPQHVAQAPVEQPQPQPVAPTQAPTPAPVAAAPAPAPVASIGTGTGMALTSGSKVCTSNLPGDKLVATVNNAITGDNGAIIPSGSQVVLEVASINPDQSGGAQITFRVRSILVNDKPYNVAASVQSLGNFEQQKVADTDPNGDKKKVIGGAIAGAILGQLIGHNTKSTIIGAAAGGAAGAVVAHRGGQSTESCLPAGSPLRLTLDAPLVLTTT